MKNQSDIHIDSLPCGIIKVNKDRKVLHGNRYALNLLSCESADAIAGLNIEDLVSYASRIFVDSYVYPILLSEGKAEEIQLSLKPVTGTIAPVVANIQMNPDKTTDWTFMSCINRDQLYDELLAARDTLQSQASDLTRINALSQERQSDLQVFCRSLSHDFTGPLRRIRQLIEVAVEDMQENGIEAPKEFQLLNDAHKNTKTLTQMTKGLVDYLVADVAVSFNETVDLEEIVATVMTIREEQDSTAPNVHRTELPTLVGNKAQMQVIFTNLIENAIKYNENDPEITISHTVNVVKDQIVFAIKDNGIGMSDAHLDKIFTPFARLNTSDEYEGSGLGLSIVKKLVMNHGGEIRVESSPGNGSTFYISLPYSIA